MVLRLKSFRTTTMGVYIQGFLEINTTTSNKFAIMLIKLYNFLRSLHVERIV